MKSKISYAVAAILGGTSWRLAAEQATSTETSHQRGLAEITVTAQRRSENMQDVPISMQALTAADAAAAQHLDLRRLHQVSAERDHREQRAGPERGVHARPERRLAGQPGQRVPPGLWPNVAIYLDNQSGQLPNRNLDIYAADLNRIEVLEGPQGTLFGAGAEAGVIRYITNEPKLDVTEGSVKAGYGVTAHGDPNTDVTAVLNLPLIAGNDGRARRDLRRPSRRLHRQRAGDLHAQEHRHRHPLRPAELPAGAPTRRMHARTACRTTATACRPAARRSTTTTCAGNAINPVTYQGIRVEALYKFNDDWDVLITQSYQDMNSQGVFYQQPNASDGAPLQPLEVTLFNPAYDKDKFESTAWTLNGKFGDLEGRLHRRLPGTATSIRSATTPTTRAACTPTTTSATVRRPTGASADVHLLLAERHLALGRAATTHQQHELRFSTPDDWRLRGIVGAY